MNLALLIIVLALGWAGATGSFNLLNLLLGAAIGAAGLFVMRRYVTGPRALLKLRRVLGLGWLFLKELFMSAIRVARLVIRPDLKAHLRPAIVAYPLRVKRDAEITLLANMITLTPGTLSIDVSEDRRFLYIHTIVLTDREAFIAEIRDGFEARVIEVFQ